jgi:hypothetical protein
MFASVNKLYRHEAVPAAEAVPPRPEMREDARRLLVAAQPSRWPVLKRWGSGLSFSPQFESNN